MEREHFERPPSWAKSPDRVTWFANAETALANDAAQVVRLVMKTRGCTVAEAREIVRLEYLPWLLDLVSFAVDFGSGWPVGEEMGA